jgi:hypothetical protein
MQMLEPSPFRINGGVVKVKPGGGSFTILYRD